jgi:N-acyl-D-aspartate/D-glutamate deacylase
VTFDWSGFAGYFQKLESRGTAINVGTLVPSALAQGDESFVDAAMQAGALGVIADSGNPAELARMASLAGRYNSLLESSVQPGAPPAEATEGLLDVVARTRTTLLVVDLMSLDPGGMTAVVQHVGVSGQRGLRAFATLSPYAAAAGESDAPIRALVKNWIVIGSNSAAVSATTPGMTTPAAFGSFPRVVGQWVRDDRLLDLVEAIRRITASPAAIFDLPQRGIIRQNYFADIVIFDPGTIADRATFDKPNEYAAGIDYVIVNGVVTLAPNGLTGSRAGHRLLGSGARRPAS